ncbi:MAG: hypothetical protein ACKOTH_00090, partial [Solirubrobacterales bacterium]
METRDQGPDRFTDKALDETVLTRRQAMALGAAAGVAATGAGALSFASTAGAQVSTSYAPPLKTVPPPPVPLFSDQTLTFQTLYDLLTRSKGKKYVTFTVSEG